jgi:predicted phosphate transport protein (TIGR00153 family)
MAKSRLDKIRRSLGGETTLEGVIDAMGREREEQVLDRLGRFTDQVVVMVEKLQDVVQGFAADRYDDLAAAAKELDKLESVADDAKEAILDQISLGGVFPMHRADLARLVGSMDNIANLATGVADRISMRRITLPQEMNEQLIAMGR